MAEYIEREALLQTLEEVGGCDAPPDSWADGWDKGISEAIKFVKELPAADVVEVVRCKNCKHGRNIDKNKSPEKYFREGCIVCTRGDGDEPKIYLPTHYCSYGARMGGDTE